MQPIFLSIPKRGKTIMDGGEDRGVGELPNAPSNLQEALQAPKNVSLSCKMRNNWNPHEKTCLKTHFRQVNIITAWSHLSTTKRHINKMWNSGGTYPPLGAAGHHLAALLHWQAPDSLHHWLLVGHDSGNAWRGYLLPNKSFVVQKR